MINLFDTSGRTEAKAPAIIGPYSEWPRRPAPSARPRRRAWAAGTAAFAAIAVCVHCVVPMIT
ncbi:MAG: hypothetical protein AAFR47_02785 [Pseudomonadota bacterium]